MKKLRSFIYLDNYKMYSISSQLFEGLTEYIVQTKKQNTKEEETQKGPIGSGRILADIIEKDSSQTEKKFLHDYSYNLFEDALIEDKRVLEIDINNIQEKINNIGKYSFVKITGNVVFNDLKTIEDTIKNFNEIGGALGYITQKTAYDDEVKGLQQSVNSLPDRNQKAKAKSFLKSKTEFKKHLIEAGLNMEDDYLKSLAYVLDYGYNQQFEVQIPIRTEDDSYHLFSAQLKRENLKDDEYSIIKKYSRETEKKFTLFGILSQRLTAGDKENIFAELKASQDDIANPNMKEVLMNMVSVLTGLEKTFTGKLDYEFVVDPISLYLEI